MQFAHDVNNRVTLGIMVDEPMRMFYVALAFCKPPDNYNKKKARGIVFNRCYEYSRLVAEKRNIPIELSLFVKSYSLPLGRETEKDIISEFRLIDKRIRGGRFRADDASVNFFKNLNEILNV